MGEVLKLAFCLLMMLWFFSLLYRQTLTQEELEEELRTGKWLRKPGIFELMAMDIRGAWRRLRP